MLYPVPDSTLWIDDLPDGRYLVVNAEYWIEWSEVLLALRAAGHIDEIARSLREE